MSETSQNHDEILKRLDNIDEKLNPIHDAYMAANRLGSWAKIGLYFVGAVLGIVIAIKQIFKD